MEEEFEGHYVLLEDSRVIGCASREIHTGEVCEMTCNACYGDTVCTLQRLRVYQDGELLSGNHWKEPCQILPFGGRA